MTYKVSVSFKRSNKEYIFKSNKRIKRGKYYLPSYSAIVKVNACKPLPHYLEETMFTDYKLKKLKKIPLLPILLVEKEK